MATERIRPREAPVIPEGDVHSRLITPYTARIIGGTFDATLLTKPSTVLDEGKAEAFTTHLRSATPDALSYRGIEELSLQSRTEYWKDSDQSFTEQNNVWNEKTWNWMKAQVSDDAVRKDDAKAAFSSLGVTLENEEKMGDLQTEVEKFRTKYFGEKSDVKKFVTDIAAGATENGQVNLATFEKRLRAVEGLLSAFGESYDVPTLVKEYIVAHSLLTQQAEQKANLTPFLMPYLRVPFADAMALHFSKQFQNLTLRPSDRTVQERKQDTPPSASDDETSEGYSPSRRSDDEKENNRSRADSDRSTQAGTGSQDTDPTTRSSGAPGDIDRSTSNTGSQDADPTTSTSAESADSDRSTSSTSGSSSADTSSGNGSSSSSGDGGSSGSSTGGGR